MMDSNTERVRKSRPLHNPRNFPFPDLPQNEGHGTIKRRPPPKFLGGDDQAKTPGKKFEKKYNKYTIFLDK